MSDDYKCEHCGGEPAEDDHPCPYQLELNDNDDPCNCCPDCERQCAEDV